MMYGWSEGNRMLTLSDYDFETTAIELWQADKAGAVKLIDWEPGRFDLTKRVRIFEPGIQ